MNRYVRLAAIEKGIRSVVVCPAMIYGTGRGAQPNNDQIPKLIGLVSQASISARVSIAIQTSTS